MKEIPEHLLIECSAALAAVEEAIITMYDASIAAVEADFPNLAQGYAELSASLQEAHDALDCAND